MKADSGATINGRKPIPSAEVVAVGQPGAARESAPQAGQPAAMGAGPGDGGGMHIPNPGESAPALDGPKADAERISTGTTASEQKKRLAKRMYPSSNGLGEYGAPTGV